MRTNDRRIRILAVYIMLKNAVKPMTIGEIRKAVEEDYNINACEASIRRDLQAIELFACVRCTVRGNNVKEYHI